MPDGWHQTLAIRNRLMLILRFLPHIRVCMRPLPDELLNGTCLFLEQAYDYILGPALSTADTAVERRR